MIFGTKHTGIYMWVKFLSRNILCCIAKFCVEMNFLSIICYFQCYVLSLLESWQSWWEVIEKQWEFIEENLFFSLSFYLFSSICVFLIQCFSRTFFPQNYGKIISKRASNDILNRSPAVLPWRLMLFFPNLRGGNWSTERRGESWGSAAKPQVPARSRAELCPPCPPCLPEQSELMMLNCK